MTTKYKTTALLYPIAILTIICISGCGSASQNERPNQQYVLEAACDHQPSDNPLKDFLKVRRFRISNSFESTHLVYRTSDVTYETDFYNSFLVSPASNITEEAIKYLRQTNIFADVVDISSHINAQLLLEGEISALYADFRDPAQPTAVMEIYFSVINNTKGSKNEIFHQTYCSTTPLTANSPDAVVKALNTSMEEILNNLTNDLKILYK